MLTRYRDFLRVIAKRKQIIRRENLRYVVECKRSWEPTLEHYWVYHFGKSFYVSRPWWDRAHHSIKSEEALSRWIERTYYTRVIRVIPEKDLKAERTLRNAAQLRETSGSFIESRKAFIDKLSPEVARLVGGTSVVTFKSPSPNVRWGTKRRSRP